MTTPGTPGFGYPTAQYTGSFVPAESDFTLLTNNTVLSLATSVSATGLNFIFLESVTALPNSGIFTMDGERIKYDGKSGSNTLTLSGVSLRGFDGSAPAIHTAPVSASFDTQAFQHNKLVVELRALMSGVNTLMLGGSVVTATGSGLQGGGAITSNPAISLLDQAITAGMYVNPVIQVNGKGVIESIASGGTPVTTTRTISTTAGHLVGGGDLSANRTLSLAPIPGLVGQEYITPSSVTVDQYGRVIAIVAGLDPPVIQTVDIVGSSLAAGGTVTLTAFWPTAFADINYSVVATITDNSSPSSAMFVVNVYVQATGYVQFAVKNVGVSSATYGVTFVGYKAS